MKIAPGHTWKCISILALVAPLAVGLAGPEHRDSRSSTTSSDAQDQYTQALDKVGKTGEWNDPETVLANVVFDNLPITEVGQNLKDLFNNEFDIILPFGSTDAR